MGLSFGHILVLLVIILVMFGLGKLPNAMGDIGKGIRNFKDGLKGDLPEDDKSKTATLPPADKKGE